MTVITKAPMMAFRLGLGLVLTVVAMSSFKENSNKSNLVEVNWGRQQDGTFIQIDPNDYSCETSTGICKVVYEQGYTPLTGASTEAGFIRKSADFGYILPL